MRNNLVGYAIGAVIALLIALLVPPYVPSPGDTIIAVIAWCVFVLCVVLALLSLVRGRGV